MALRAPTVLDAQDGLKRGHLVHPKQLVVFFARIAHHQVKNDQKPNRNLNLLRTSLMLTTRSPSSAYIKRLKLQSVSKFVLCLHLPFIHNISLVQCDIVQCVHTL